MAFPTVVAERALLACARYCCLCHKFCGNKIETHHIEQGSDDSFENCIPLCFDCHAEVGSYNPQHPKGRKFSASELRAHRDRWYQLVKEGKYLLAGGFLPGEKVMLNYDLKFPATESAPILAVDVINTGDCPIYIKDVSLGWAFAGDDEHHYSKSILTAKEDWKTALPAGLNREYHGSIGPIIVNKAREPRAFRDVWISVETPRGEIQRVVGLSLMFSFQLLPFVSRNSSTHVVGEFLYPT